MQKFKRSLSILLSVIMVLSLFTIVPFTAGAATTESAATGVSYSYRYDITLRMLPMNLYESDGWTLSEHSYDGISVSIYSGSGSQLGYSSAATTAIAWRGAAGPLDMSDSTTCRREPSGRRSA